MPDTPMNDPTLTDESVPSDDNTVGSVATEFAPWLISLAVHAAIVLLAMFIVWSAMRSPPDDVQPPPNLALTAQLQPADKLVVREARNVDTTSTRQRPAPPKAAPQRLLQPTEVNVPKWIGIRNASSSSSVGIFTGDTDTLGKGFMGVPLGPSARSVVYLVDASGSLVDTLPFVITELQRSIGDLHESQRFTVIFFQGDQAIEPAPQGLRPATAANKQRVISWLSPDAANITPVGAANPLPAIRQALKYKPQLVFLLSDNITGRQQYELNQDRLLDEMRRANVAQTRISTIQFIQPDPLTRYGITGTLERIATEHRGAFKFVSADELGIH